MAIRFMTEVWERSRCTGNSLLVLLACADSANTDTGQFWPSYATLAKKARISPRHAMRIVKHFVDLGVITKEQRISGKVFATNVYRLVYENIASADDYGSDKASEGSDTVSQGGSDTIASEGSDTVSVGSDTIASEGVMTPSVTQTVIKPLIEPEKEPSKSRANRATTNKPKKEHPFWSFIETFQAHHLNHTNMPYVVSAADRGQMESLVKQAAKSNKALTAEDWDRACKNYFASVVGVRSIATLATYKFFIAYWQNPLDQYNKPMGETSNGRNSNNSTTSGDAGTARMVSRWLADVETI